MGSVIVYSKPGCNYCVKAKSLLLSKGKPFQEMVVGQDLIKEDFTNMFPGVTTLPLVFIDGQQIGGYNDLVEHLNNNNSQFLVE